MHDAYLETKKARRMAGGQSMIVGLVDQSRHRAANARPRHHRAAFAVFEMSFRISIRGFGTCGA
jgi:hypothetical protein